MGIPSWMGRPASLCSIVLPSGAAVLFLITLPQVNHTAAWLLLSPNPRERAGPRPGPENPPRTESTFIFLEQQGPDFLSLLSVVVGQQERKKKNDFMRQETQYSWDYLQEETTLGGGGLLGVGRFKELRPNPAGERWPFKPTPWVRAFG